jgi:hypothetical protein
MFYKRGNFSYRKESLVSTEHNPAKKYVARNVNLEACDYRAVKQFCVQNGLGGKGFSAALRMIIREWAALKPNQDLSTEELLVHAEGPDERTGRRPLAPLPGPGEPGFVHPPFP